MFCSSKKFQLVFIFGRTTLFGILAAHPKNMSDSLLPATEDNPYINYVPINYYQCNLQF